MYSEKVNYELDIIFKMYKNFLRKKYKNEFMFYKVFMNGDRECWDKAKMETEKVSSILEKRGILK